MLQVIQVTKNFGKTQALRSTDLSILQGHTTVILGPSGCGKSTLLKLLIGLIGPDLGKILFQGKELTRTNIPSLRQKMGYVIQEGGLFPHLTAQGNVTLMAKYVGWHSDRIQNRMNSLAELTQFPKDHWTFFPTQLSGGQKQRVSLMRALMLDPDVLLLDEPLGSLDPMIRYHLQTDLRYIFRTLQKTVVMVTHDLGEAGFFGDRIVLMREGRIVQQGTLSDFINTPKDPFVTQFIQAQRGPLENWK